MLSPEIRRIASAYRKEFGFSLSATDSCGGWVHRAATQRTDCACGGPTRERRLEAARETLRWGETVINLCCDEGYAMWAVPVLDNNRLRGGLLVQGVSLECPQVGWYERIHRAASRLLELAQAENLVPCSAIQLARRRAEAESERFSLIQVRKAAPVVDDLRAVYLREEPGLLAAIKSGELGRARASLNRILVQIYAMADRRPDLLKSCILELVVMMSRAAVEAGADQASILGRNYLTLTKLADIDDEEELSDWLRETLENLIHGIRTHDRHPHSLLLQRAVAFMTDNLHRPLRRDEVARIAGVAPSHFSRLVADRLGRPYSQLLTQMRVDRAKELLVLSDRSLGEIALDCGFFDQSHFSRTFRKATQLSPSQFRRGSEEGREHGDTDETRECTSTSSTHERSVVARQRNKRALLG